MDEVMEDLDIADVRAHNVVGSIHVADGLHEFNIDIECESFAEEIKADYNDDESSNRGDDSANSSA